MNTWAPRRRPAAISGWRRSAVAFVLALAGLFADAAPAGALEPSPRAAVAALQDRVATLEAQRTAADTIIPPDQRARLATTYRQETVVVAAAVGGAVALGAIAGGAQLAVAAGVAMLAVYLLLP